jgi:hypothetical protein
LQKAEGLLQQRKGDFCMATNENADESADSFWCECVGGGRYDGDLICIPHQADLFTTNQVVDVRSSGEIGTQEKILRAYYERTGKTRRCPKLGVVHFYKFTEAVLDELCNEFGEEDGADEDQDGGCYGA